MRADKLKQDPNIKSILEEGGLETPGDQFTSNIINKIEAQSLKTEYKPVISRTAWLVLSFIGVAIFSYFLFVNASSGNGLSFQGYTLDFDFNEFKAFMGQFKISFELTPIFRTSLIALTVFTFTYLLFFELKSKITYK